MQKFVGLLLVVSITGSGCGGGGRKGKCGEGTFLHGGKCYAIDPNDDTPPVLSTDPPSRTRFVGDVRLTSGEPAVIYYTVDGTTPTAASPNEPDVVLVPDVPEDGVVKAFAIDLAGNQSDVQTFTWEVDRAGPGLRDLDLVVSGSQRTVTWTNPTDDDFAGVIVARVRGQLAAPLSGTFYDVGETLAPAVNVAFVGSAGSFTGTTGTFTETLAVEPGIVRYVAWGYDDLGNYGAASGDYELTTLAPQTGAISVDAATGVFTVSAQPANLNLSGTATYDVANSELTIDLGVENETTRVLFAPKVVIQTLSLGSFNNSDGQIGGLDFRSYGAAITPGMVASGGGGPPVPSRPLVISGVGATDVVAITLEILHNPVVAGAFSDNGRAATIGDPVSQLETIQALGAGSEGRGPGGEQRTRGGAITPDGRLYLGHKNVGRVSSFDLTTGELVGGVTIEPQKSSVPRIIGDRTGSNLYALVLKAHIYGVRVSAGDQNTTETFLVRVDPAGLTETGRIALGQGRGRDLDVSPDGALLAIANGLAEVVVVDVASFRIQSRFAIGGDGIHTVTFSADGETLYATSRLGSLFPITLATGEIAGPVALSGTGRVFDAVLAPDNRVWISRQNTLDVYDPADGSVLTYPRSGGHIALVDGEIYHGSNGNSGFDHIVQADGTSDFNVSAGNSIYGHWLGGSPF